MTPTFHLDGAFQTASGLYRLDAGQMPGRDFFPYLGIAPILILFPIFKLFGSNLAASGFAAQFIVLIMGAASIATIFHLVASPQNKSTSLLAGFAIFAGCSIIFFISGGPLLEWLQFALTPSNSLKPVRAFAPYLAAVLAIVKTRDTEWQRYSIRGIFCSIILLWSNDFAITTAGLFSILMLPIALREKCFNRKCAAAYFLALTISSIILYLACTAGHPLALLKYNFIDVAHDQWWYFGGYGEEDRIFNLYQITRLVSDENYFPLAVLITTSTLALISKNQNLMLAAWIGLALLTGGAVAAIGGHIGHYMGPFYLWGIWVMIAGLVSIIMESAVRLKILEYYTTPLLLCISAYTLYISYENYKTVRFSAQNNEHLFYSPELGGYLETQWKDYINMAKNSDGSVVIEEYWGLWSATRKSFSGWPVDATIHALGETRTNASKQMSRAGTIISTRNSLSHDWQAWSLSQNYWFYTELLHKFTPISTSPNTIIWKRNKDIANTEISSCQTNNNDQPSITIINNRNGFYEITMNYRFSSRGRYLTMIKNNISYAANADGYVSFDPDGQTVTFPAYLKENSVPLEVSLKGTADRKFSITSCSARFITADDSEATKIPNETKTR
jgi:hypothetical protein